jgi:bis(5'-nucleosyl)-tetraphosphatase (symmetrical)
MAPRPRAFTRALWIVEGITAYYDDLLVHRAGLATREEYRKAFSRSSPSTPGSPAAAEAVRNGTVGSAPMATYAIGDVHGCFTTLEALLRRIGFDRRHDRLWLVGDLVNRGPDSLAVLRWARELSEGAVAVLGNHELHLLARAAGLAKANPRDTLDELLAAADGEELIAWVREWPLLHRRGDDVLVHAGLLPAWTLEEAEELAGEVAAALRGEGGADLLAAGKGKALPPWGASLPPSARRRLGLAAFTNLRTLTADGRLCQRFAGPPEEAPPGCRPWFTLASRRPPEVRLVFGHWAALGLHRAPGLVALDSGCVWGGHLSALRLDDGALFQEWSREVAAGAPRRG